MTVTDIHPGGQAHFHCDPGFEVRGHEVATCLNSTRPRWSTSEPQCVGGLHLFPVQLFTYLFSFIIYSGFKTPPFIALCISIHMCFCILKLYLVEDGLEMLLLAASSLQPSLLQVTIAAVAI